MSATLLVVDLVLRQQKEGAALEQLGRLVADYLGPNRNLLLCDACKFGSTTLLDWMWGCSPTSASERSPHWSLTNYLRSDLHYYQYQFHDSTLVAAERGDLRVLEWLMGHFSGCEVPVPVVEIAAKDGRLDILRSLLEHDAGRGDGGEPPSRKKRKVDTGGESKAKNQQHAGGNAVQWGGRSLVNTVRENHYDIVRFLIDSTPRDVYLDTLNWATQFLLYDGEVELAEMLLPPGKPYFQSRVMMIAAFWGGLELGTFASNPDVLARGLDAGLLDDLFQAGRALRTVARFGRLDLMKQFWEKHAQVTTRGDWMGDWLGAMSTACESGNLPMLQWMVEQASGQALITFMGKYMLDSLLYNAAKGGHLHVMQYLYEQDLVSDFGVALLSAIRGDKMDVVKWLVAHFPSSEKIPECCILVEAARRGRVEMLQFFQSSVELEVPGFPGSKPSSIHEEGEVFHPRIRLASANAYTEAWNFPPSSDFKWLSTDTMDDAAANNQLNAVQWLHLNRSEGCTTKAMDDAAGSGRLEVVKWLHTNRSEGCTVKAMDESAANGHLEVVKWLLANRSEGYTNPRMGFASLYEHAEVVKCLVVQQSRRKLPWRRRLTREISRWCSG